MIHDLQVCFYNNIAMMRGGTHVAHVAGKIVANVLTAINKKNKTARMKPFQFKNHM